MKTLWTILALLYSCILTCAGQGRNIVGTDIASAISQRMFSLYVGHSFSDSWSAEAAVSINAGRLADGPDSEAIEHWKELYGEGIYTGISEAFYLVESSVSLQFWPQHPYQGPVISIGGCIKDRNGPDLTAAIGYYCRIWKGMTAVLIYKRDIIESVKGSNMPAECIKIGLAYVF